MADDETVLDLRGLLPSWELAMKAKNLSKATRKLYMRGVMAYIEYCESGDELPSLERRQVQEFMAAFMEDLGRAASSTKHYLKGIKNFVRWCVAEGELTTENILTLEAPNAGKPLRKMMEADAHEAILATCNGRTFADLRDAALLRLLRDAGPRAKEIVGLKVDDVSIARGHAVVHGKGSKDRYVAFSDGTALALDRYLRKRRQHKHASSDDLWLGINGPTFGYFGLNHMLKRRAALAGIPHATAHMWRRLFAHSWLDRGGSTDGLKALAGWTSDVMVAHYTEEYQAQRALKEARRLFEAGEPER